MTDWLSTTWEANWRPFQYFNLYRLVLAGLFFLAILLPHEWTARLDLAASGSLLALAIAYLFVILGGLFLSFHWQQHFNFQLSLQVVVDVVVVSLFMYAAGGVGSGIGVLLLVSLAAASMVGRGRLVLFYAALATLAPCLVSSMASLRAASIRPAFFRQEFFPPGSLRPPFWPGCLVSA